jgi:hypothetical protein
MINGRKNKRRILKILKNLVAVELKNKRTTYDFVYPLSDGDMKGIVEIADNDISSINGNYKEVALTISKVNNTYSINTYGEDLTSAYEISENIDNIINDIKSTIEQ